MSTATTTPPTPWPTVKLGDVCEVVLGGTPSTKIEDYWGDDVNWLTPSDMGKIEGIYVESTSRKITQEGLLKGSRLFPEKSVIVSTRAPIGYVLINTVPMCTNQGCKTLVPNKDVLAEFLCLNLRGRTDELNALGTGTTFRELATGNLKSISIPLPPLDIQREIVAKVEAGLKEADALVAHFKRLAALADDTFKAELDETFSTLKDAPKEKLGDLGRVAMCKRIMKFQTTTTGDVPFYKIGTFGKSPNAYISKSLFQEFKGKFSYPEKGDVLISAAGTIGRSVIFDGAPAYFQDSNIVWLEHNRSRLMNEYLNYFYQTKPWKISEGVTIQRLYNGDIESISIPLPSLDIQREIVAKLEAVKVRCEQLKAEAERGLKSAEALRKAVLAEAFEQ